MPQGMLALVIMQQPWLNSGHVIQNVLDSPRAGHRVEFNPDIDQSHPCSERAECALFLVDSLEKLMKLSWLRVELELTTFYLHGHSLGVGCLLCSRVIFLTDLNFVLMQQA